MTVKELIEKLQEYPEDYEVYVPARGGYIEPEVVGVDDDEEFVIIE